MDNAYYKIQSTKKAARDCGFVYLNIRGGLNEAQSAGNKYI